MNYIIEIAELQNKILNLEEKIQRKNEIIKRLYMEIEDRNCIIIIFSCFSLLVYCYNARYKLKNDFF
jgi:hypothetical protein